MRNTYSTFDMIYRYVGGWIWLSLFIIAVLYFFIVAKKQTKLAMLATLISLGLFINDLVLNFVENTMKEHQRYYRYLWIVPFILIIVTFFVEIYSKLKYIVLRIILIAGGVGLWIILYRSSGWIGILPDYNIKIASDGIIAISDQLDELRGDKDIFVACPYDVSDYLQMYNGRIYCTSDNKIVSDDESGQYNLSSENPDVDRLMSACCAKGMDYLVVKYNGDSRENYEEKGHYPIMEEDGLGLYECKGYEGYIQDYNDWGQVEWVTYVDDNRNPIIGLNGYSTVNYVYDKYGNIIREYYTDTEGNLVTNKDGYAGYEKKYDFKNREVSLVRIDTNGEPTEIPDGYTEKRTKYGIREKTYSYYDSKGNPVMTSEGYSILRCSYDKNNRLIREEYFDEIAAPYIKPAGYTGVEYRYNDEWQISKMIYLDEKENPINRIDGYSSVKWVNNEETGARDVSFYDLSGREIPLDGLNLVRGIKTGADGWSAWMTPSKDTVNSCFTIGTVNLGPKVVGDKYTCYICIEIKNVTVSEGKDFQFFTQGSADGSWKVGNVWRQSLIWFQEPPKDGVYIFRATESVNEAMTHMSEFGVGFRCDNWASGEFRVRDVMIVKGEEFDEWKPGL